MKCENCKIKDAVIKISQVTNNQKKEMNLCKDCANLKGMNNPLAQLSTILGSMITNIINKIAEENDTSEDIICKGCSMSLKRFMTTGLLGCGDCYNSFEATLKRILHRYHGATGHVGTEKEKINSKPFKAEKIYQVDELKQELNEAVANEKFERAAELRDSIKLLLKISKEAGDE